MGAIMPPTDDTTTAQINRDADRIFAETRKLLAEESKLLAEERKLAAEGRKLARETFWYPALIGAGLLAAGSGLTAGVLRILGHA